MGFFIKGNSLKDKTGADINPPAYRFGAVGESLRFFMDKEANFANRHFFSGYSVETAFELIDTKSKNIQNKGYTLWQV
jgi:hypothetical protein